jgi:site-specific recombinase XerC
MLDTLGTGPAGLRDRALLLLGFAGAFRRSELVALDIADLAFTPAGLWSPCAAPKPTRKRAAHRRVYRWGYMSCDMSRTGAQSVDRSR